MYKSLRRLLMPVLLLTAFLAFSPTALALSEVTTSITGGTATITNNYGISDTVAITLSTPASVNTVYWVYLPGPTDKTAQLGIITIKNGATTGKLSVAAGKLSDFASGGYLNITTAGGAMVRCDYDPADGTSNPGAGTVTLRNSATGAEMLIVDKNIVTKGMTATAIVNGKLYKATAKADGVELQVPLAANMEIGTPVWYTIADAGCLDVGYSQLTLIPVATTIISPGTTIRVFYQGSTATTSSIMVWGLTTGDTVRYINTTTGISKSLNVANSATMVNFTNLKFTPTDAVSITVTQKGKLESTPVTVPLPADVASTALNQKSNPVSVSNSIATGATVTVKNVTEGDTVNIYKADGSVLVPGGKVAPEDDDPLDPAANNDTADVVFDSLNLGDAATSVYVSVTSTGKSESTWLAVKVPAATP